MTGHGHAQPAVMPLATRTRPDMTDGRRQAAERYADMAGQLGDDIAIVAERVGKAKRTVRRWRADALRLGLV